ncbi:hypothetical protein ACFQFG_12480 [Methylobacterium persicinum]
MVALEEARGFGAAVAAFPRHLIAGWAALAGAGMLLLHGNLLLAALLGIGGLWSLEGPAGLGRRLRSVMPTRATSEKRIRTRLISIVILPDGSFAGGVFARAPWAARGSTRSTCPPSWPFSAFAGARIAKGLRS